MFWKKKRNDLISLELDTDDRRNGVRIHSLDTIIVHFDGQQSELFDISSHGLAFKSNQLKQGDCSEITFYLPVLESQESQRTNQNSDISCTIKVVFRDNDICHCQITQIKSEDKIRLDRFILNEQKRQIRAQKLNSYIS